MVYTEEQKNDARERYWKGETIPEISRALNIQRRTLYNWQKADGWSIARPDDPEILIRRRIGRLLDMDDKTETQLRELALLLEHDAKIEGMRQKYQTGNSSTGSSGSGESGSRGERVQRQKKKNDFTQIDVDALMEKFREGLFEYQLECWENRTEKIRNILKSRQIGMTWYFAREAFVDALISGRNKIFISASQKQVGQFRKYIREFAAKWFGITLVGTDVIELHTHCGTASLYFLATNARTAQSYNGDLYIDEYFWIPKFEDLKDFSMGMASQDKWNITFFSTPFSKGSAAYKFWSGDEFNEQQKQENKPLIIFPERAVLRKKGVHCPDLCWRRIITIEDAEREGCNLFNIEKLKIMFSPERFDLLFRCRFIDDGKSCFKFSELEKCLANSKTWDFFKPDKPRPYAGPVWIGYDPSRVRDGASIVVLAVPKEAFTGKFYVLEKITLKNAAWEYQAGTIRDLCQKYNVEHIGIDITGPGSGVYEQVCRFFPAAEAINYTLDVKAKLVLKAQQVIGAARIAWDSCYSDIAAGFLLIRRVTTQNANITYVADRSDLTGHADAAWAIMHALFHEDLIRPEADDGQTCVIG